MQFQILLLLATAASALTIPQLLAKRQSSTSCGSDHYTTDDVDAAANAECNYLYEGSYAGSSDYPHEYENYEGFNFTVSGPYYEFPIIEGGVYDGGEPGADRVIINSNCQFAGTITHTGASGDDFVGCNPTY